MQFKLTNTALSILEAISYLSKNKKNINANSVSIRANISWSTAKKYMTNNFYIKE